MKNTSQQSTYRRRIIASVIIASCALAASLIGAEPVVSQLNKAQAGYYRMKVGAYEVKALSDGTVSLNVQEVLLGAGPDEITKRLGSASQTEPIPASINAFLIKAGSKLIMVDAGAGELFGPTLNKLPASLRAIGYAPEQITDILLTHIHPDHAGGLMDGARMVYPNAVIHVEKREVDFWLNPENVAKAKPYHKTLFANAVATVKPLCGCRQGQDIRR